MAYGRAEPLPFWLTYVFSGFAVVMALIAVSLAVLLCSRRKRRSRPPLDRASCPS
ncbi:unnamed protein product [Miscanthus lutarioriparius]|uniref:Uncharacterized protein n=1 Tax=Miscanthus lutarioriparius TaxID=422564 RepID=A0A811MDR0_9POAL|nr:unnamed protein product [Miscanthus lutarioriparius]